MKAGFIGLGTLGRTMARRLIGEGVKLTVYNRTRSKAEGLDAVVADTPAEVFEKNKVIFLNLFDSEAVKSVILGKGGFLECDCAEDKVIVDTTTNHFDSAVYFHSMLEEHGSAYLEAPVLGSVVPASKGALTVIVSGREEAYKKALPLIKVVGSTVHYLRERGAATKMKLINNLVLGNLMAALAEAVSFAEAVGIKREQALDILASGAGKSGVLDAKRQKLLEEDFSTHFSSALIYKDLHYLQDLARTLGKPLFTAAAAKELYAATYGKGIEGEDFSAVYKIIQGFGKREIETD